MAAAGQKRVYLALAVWGAAFLLALALRLAGLIEPPVEALGLSFVLGVAAILVFFRQP